jgi:hypothetical protein
MEVVSFMPTTVQHEALHETAWAVPPSVNIVADVKRVNRSIVEFTLTLFNILLWLKMNGW